MIAIWDCVLSP